MGINFQSTHPDTLFDDDSLTATRLRDRFGPDLPLGTENDHFCLDAEMAWSWWQDLQHFAAEKLGDDRSQQIHATHAWCAVYLDTNITRDFLPGPNQPDEKPRDPAIVTMGPPPSLLTRLARLVGIKTKQDKIEDFANQAMKQMVELYAPPPPERHGLQIGNLRLLIAELESLLHALNIPPTSDAVETLRQSYANDESRCDDDPHVQCLCHAWLTAAHALETRSPLWLIK